MLLTGCTTNKIERSQQDIKQEKVEKAKKEIANGHKVIQGLNTQTDNYCWRCIDCNKEVGYEICNEHNTPATPEHMQLHLN